MKKYLRYVFISLALLFILIPILVFHLDNDHAIYQRGAVAILSGKTIFVDFVDVKQPVWYYLTALIIKIFGNREYSLRFFDFLFQIFVFISFYYTGAKISGKKVIGYIAAFCYSISYVSLGFSQTLQPDNFANIFFVWAIFFLLKKNTNLKTSLFSGVLLGFAAAMKLTLGIAIIPALCYIYFQNGLKLESKKIKNSIVLSLGFVLIFAVSFLPLLNPNAYAGFKLVYKFLGDYNALSPSGGELAKVAIQSISGFLGDNYSFAFLFLISAAILLQMKKNRNEIIILLAFSVFLLISVVVEKKFIPYHFSRAYASLSLLCGFGGEALINEIRSVNFKKTYLILLTPLFLLFSPLLRIINIWTPVIFKFTSEQKYNAFYQRDGKSDINRESVLKAVEIIKSDSSGLDPLKTMVVSIGSAPIFCYLHNENYSFMGQSHLLTSVKAPKLWVDKAYGEIAGADWLILQTNDRHPLLTGHNMTSYEWIEAHSAFKQLVDSKFVINSKLTDMIIYKRSKNETAN